MACFQTISWVDSHQNVLNIRTESPNSLILVFNKGVFQILMCKKSIFRCIHIRYTLGSLLPYFNKRI